MTPTSKPTLKSVMCKRYVAMVSNACMSMEHKRKMTNFIIVNISGTDKSVDSIRHSENVDGDI